MGIEASYCVAHPTWSKVPGLPRKDADLPREATFLPLEVKSPASWPAGLGPQFIFLNRLVNIFSWWCTICFYAVSIEQVFISFRSSYYTSSKKPRINDIYTHSNDNLDDSTPSIVAWWYLWFHQSSLKNSLQRGDIWAIRKKTLLMHGDGFQSIEKIE